MSKTVISFKIDAKLKDILQQLAKSETRTLSNYLLTVIQAHLESKGIEWRTEEQLKKDGEEIERSTIHFSSKELRSSLDDDR